MLTLIYDPEPEWKATNTIWLEEEARRKKVKEEKERGKKIEDSDAESATFIVDKKGDRQLRQNYLNFNEVPIDEKDRYRYRANEGIDVESATESEDTQFDIGYY